MQKKAQAIQTIMTMFAVVIGLFIIISAYPIWNEITQNYVDSHPNDYFKNFILQLLPIAAVMFLILLIFIGRDVNPFG